MSSLIAVAILCATLFFLSFITKRRFGVLGLALAAGALLSLHWAQTLTPFLQQQGITLVVPPLDVAVQAGLILAPSFLLLFSGPVYSKLPWRILGSAAYALLALTFLAEILRASLVLGETGQTVFDFIKENQSVLIVIGLIGALADVLLTRHNKRRDHRKSPH